MGVKARARAKTNFKSRFGKLEVVESNILEALFFCMVALLKAENSSNLLRATKSYKEFF